MNGFTVIIQRNNKLVKSKQKHLEHKYEQFFPAHISSGKGNKIKNEGLHQTKKLPYSKGHHH